MFLRHSVSTFALVSSTGFYLYISLSSKRRGKFRCEVKKKGQRFCVKSISSLIYYISILSCFPPCFSPFLRLQQSNSNLLKEIPDILICSHRETQGHDLAKEKLSCCMSFLDPRGLLSSIFCFSSLFHPSLNFWRPVSHTLRLSVLFFPHLPLP